MGDPMTVAELEAMMDSAWPAPDRQDTGEWVLRAASGVTQRANSVWPRAAASDPVATARDAALWYRRRRLPVIYQVFQDDRNSSLNELLDQQGFTRQSETLIMARAAVEDDAPTAASLTAPTGVEILDQPSTEWLNLWWSVDGRGGDPERETALKILAGCPSLYALVRDDDGVAAAVGRLALVDGHGGVYGMATRPDARRKGFARQVLNALLDEGTARGVSGYWLLVTASNAGAQQLYRQAGFEEVGRYVYRQERPKRALTGC